MKHLKHWALSLSLFLLPACGQQLVEFPNPDGGKSDARIADVANNDGAKADTAPSDSSTIDATRIETTAADRSAFEFGTPDTQDRSETNPGNPGIDGKLSDAGNPDAGNADTAVGDARVSDLPASDLPVSDARVSDLPVSDARVSDLPVSDDSVSDLPVSDDSVSGLPIGDASISEVPIADALLLDVAVIDTSNNEPSTAEVSNDGASTSACRQSPVFLGAADGFVVLAGSTVTSTGPTSVTGDLGVSPGTALTGFPPGVVVGTQHAGDPTAAQGIADLTTAYNDAAGRTLCPVTVAGNLGGQTLTPGLYKSTSSLAITSGDLTLDAEGDATAVFIFQMASTLTTTSGRQIILTGGAKSTNVFWQVGTSATLGSTSAFQGTVMADQAITLETGATLNGRALARIAAVTLDSNVVVKPAP